MANSSDGSEFLVLTMGGLATCSEARLPPDSWSLELSLASLSNPTGCVRESRQSSHLVYGDLTVQAEAVP